MRTYICKTKESETSGDVKYVHYMSAISMGLLVYKGILLFLFTNRASQWLQISFLSHESQWCFVIVICEEGEVRISDSHMHFLKRYLQNSADPY